MLIRAQLRVGYICFDELHDSSMLNKKGSPQGSLLSPLFCNILLHELDKHVDSICRDFNNKRVKVNSAE
jgi:retron-type reverse transcriptase